MIDDTLDYLTFIAWPWWIAFLIVIGALIWLANWYMDQPPSELDKLLDRLDSELSEQEAQDRVRPLTSAVQRRPSGGWKN